MVQFFLERDDTSMEMRHIASAQCIGVFDGGGGRYGTPDIAFLPKPIICAPGKTERCIFFQPFSGAYVADGFI